MIDRSIDRSIDGWMDGWMDGTSSCWHPSKCLRKGTEQNAVVDDSTGELKKITTKCKNKNLNVDYLCYDLSNKANIDFNGLPQYNS